MSKCLIAPLLLSIHNGTAVQICFVGSLIRFLGDLGALPGAFRGLTLTIAAIKRNYEAALLLLPLLLSVVGLVELASTAGLLSVGSGARCNPRLPSRPGPSPSTFPISPTSSASLSSSSSSLSASSASIANANEPPANSPPPAASRSS